MTTNQSKLIRNEKIAAAILEPKQSSKPLITVITPTYNRGEMVQTTIKSVINQTFENWELIVIDDGSTDNTEAAVQQFLNDSRISYYKKPNTGQADSLNLGTRYASGDYITFLDSDDEAYPNWLEVVSRNIKEDTNVVTVAAMRKLLNGEIVYENIDNFRFSGDTVRLKITCGSLFLRRHIFNDIGGYDPEMKSNIQTDLAYRLLTYLKKTNGKIVPVDEHLVQINIHSGPRIRTDWTKRREGTKQFLQKNYNYILENSPQDIASAYSIIAFSSYKLKDRRESLRYLFKVIKLKPFVFINYLKFFRYAFL